MADTQVPKPGQDEIRLREMTLLVCDLCRQGAGGECHVPGCAFWLSAAPDIPLRAVGEVGNVF